MTRKREREDDDLSGVGLGGMALLLTVMALRHPWQALKELLRVIGRLGRWALGRALAPAAVVVVIVSSRRRDRRPTFEDYLHGRDED
ncbi:hypothetical protein AB0C14_32690 [Microbispora hainanensis]|uniref:hypothetical protein n=1 Tax=Microbispora hainanensis TaxID=568844 RepID=UPI0033C0CBA0